MWSLLPHVLIHPSGCPGPLCWLASPSASGISPLSAAPPSLLFWATAGQAWDASSKSCGRKGGGEEREEEQGRGMGLLDSTGKELTKVLRLATRQRRGKEYLGE